MQETFSIDQSTVDKIPIFAAPSFAFDVSKSAGKINATEQDRGDNVVITYDLISHLDFETEEDFR